MENIIDGYQHKGLRRKLVNELIKKGINSTTVLDAINHIPRHAFMDQAFLHHAYIDKAFPIGEGQTISQPYTVARQTELLDIQPRDKVLEIGTGSGYQSAILLHLKARLVTVERHEILSIKAKKLLQKLGYRATFICGDGSLGKKELAPFDKIIVTAGAPFVPESLIEQLAVGGILIIPVGNDKSQKMIKITKVENKKLLKEEHGNFAFVPLIGKKGWK